MVESGCLTPNSQQDGPLFLWKARGTVTDIEKIATRVTKQGLLRIESGATKRQWMLVYSKYISNSSYSSGQSGMVNSANS